MSNENKRPTETLITEANKFKVVINKWITTQETDELTDIFRKARLSAKVDIKDQKAEMKVDETDAFIEASFVARKRAFEMVVVSINGETENLYEMILNMPSDDGQEVFEAVEYTTNPKKKDLKMPLFITPQTEDSPEISS